MKPRLSSNQMPRSLLPVTERKSQDENRGDMRKRKGSIKEKTDIAPDGASAGREGRQFAVANVGNNGRIYLRYVVSSLRDARGRVSLTMSKGSAETS